MRKEIESRLLESSSSEEKKLAEAMIDLFSFPRILNAVVAFSPL